jgi:protein-tyrosine phosphatase
MREVIPRTLWIGNASDARDVRRVLSEGITAIVDVAMEEPPIAFPRDVTYCRYPLLDGEGNSQMLLRLAIKTTAALIEAGTATLVACSGGMSRSLAIAAAALAIRQHSDPEVALEQVALTGPHDVSPGLWSEIQAVLSDRARD